MNLAEKYRPDIFEDVLAQEPAVATATAQLRRNLPLPLLFTGPPGCGKTTLSRIIARALNCEAVIASGSPCLTCEKCIEFDTSSRTWYYCEINAGGAAGKDVAAYLDQESRRPPLYGAQRRAIFIDEAHGLTSAAKDGLLEALELPGTAAFILATNQPDRLSPAFLSRCVTVELRPISDATLIAHGRAVCGLEGIAFEPDALAMIAAAAHGQARDFLHKLAQVAMVGPVTTKATGSALDLAWADLVLTSLALLLRSGFSAAERALNEWRAPAGTKARALRDALAFIAQRRLIPATGHHATFAPGAFLGASLSAIDDLTSAITERATILGVSPSECAIAWAAFWSSCASSVHDAGDLTVRMMEFALRASPPELALTPLPPKPTPIVAIPATRRRAVICAAATGQGERVNERGAWLTKKEASGIYRAATLLPQEYGLWFNTRFVLRYADYDMGDIASALRLHSSLTHEMGLRLRDWVGDAAFRLHWLTQHECNETGALETRVVMHVPPALFERTRTWLAEDFLPIPAGVLVNEIGSDVWRTSDTARPHVTHWSMVRELWRIINPAILDINEEGRRAPLTELLGVPPQRPRRPSILPARVRRFSTSHTLGSSLWRAALTERMAYVSALDIGAWGALDRGWEQHEHGYRGVEIAQRKHAVEVLEAQLPRSVSAAQDAVLEERLRALRETWPLDPMKRPRPRPLW